MPDALWVKEAAAPDEPDTAPLWKARDDVWVTHLDRAPRWEAPTGVWATPTQLN